MLGKDQNFNYQHFFELSPDLLCIAGFDGYLKKINSSVSSLLGYSEKELYENPINTFIHPDDRMKTAKVRNELFKSKALLNYENRYVCKNGSVVWLSWTSLGIESDHLIFAIAKNITHQKKIESERNKELVKLAEVNHRLQQLSYTTSHDLRSPLNSLLSVFNKIDLSKINDTRTAQLIEVSKKGGAHLKGKLDEYIDALSERNNIAVNQEPIHLESCLNDVLLSINSLIKNSNAQLTIHFSSVDYLFFNRSYLESIFLNLITNSIKYAKIGVDPIISIHSDIYNGNKRLIVKDNGVGFDMNQVKDQLFGFKKSFHNHSDSKGIGLYLVYNQVNSLGGNIEVESKVNEGSTFTITFKNEIALKN